VKESIAENALIKGCLDGKEKYFKMLFEAYYGKMLNVCKQYTRDEDHAKDILQDGFIKVFKNLKQYDFKGSFEGWVRRIIVNNAINQYKKDLKELTHYMDTEALENYSTPEEPDGLDVESAEIEPEVLLGFINELTPVYKLVFNLNVIEGYSHKDIAGILNITESTSRSNLAKARQNLRGRITQTYTTNQMFHVSYEN
jgi:RNA polymerase sigma factor (sigma-70 family)